MPKADVVIIGSGVAALMTASRLSKNKNVILFTKATKCSSNSMLAQGGIAAAISEHDHWQSHFKDTMIAGCEHSEAHALRALVETGPSYIQELIQQGMLFDCDEKGNILLAQEGAHSNRRILHAGGDATGRLLTNFLFQKVKDQLSIIEHQMAIELIVQNDQCLGVMVLNDENEPISYLAESIVLATGGSGGIYEYSSNDSSVIGDGYAMAYRAGVDLVDMEFVQFHPTLLYKNGNCPGLISEAVRGEGACLRTESGRRIMENQHPQKDLAPRDIVSRVIFEEIQSGENIHLDISMIPDFSTRFPTITSLCVRSNIQIKDGKIPIVPGAHFMMGGIKVNQYCESSLRGLYAVGEVACTGVHGANRLASNSLLEGIVFANRLADFLLNQESKLSSPIQTSINITFQEKENIALDEFPSINDIRKLVMKSVGIVRDKKELEEVIHYLEPFIHLTPQQLGYSKEVISLVNMMLTAWLIASSALKREESRGSHYRHDFPEKNKKLNCYQIIRNIKNEAYYC